MARNRVIYQSEALYVSEDIGSTGSSKHHQLERVQSANYNFAINRQDINQYGQAARIDTLVMDAPTVGLDFSYYLTDGGNEKALGFNISGDGVNGSQFSSGHMVQNSGKNFYILTVGEGLDAVGSATGDQTSVIGVGNAFLSDYSVELAVGSLPTVSVSMECSNINSDTATNGGGAGAFIDIASPAVNITDGSKIAQDVSIPISSTGEAGITALRPGDITVDISNLSGLALSDLTDSGDTDDGIHIQSASLSVPLSRSPLQRLGTRFAYARTVDFPVNVTLSVNAICTDVTAKNLADILDSTGGKDVTLNLKGNDNTTSKMKYVLKGCRLDSESFSSSIGSNKTVDLTFSTQIGGVKDKTNGLFALGTFTEGVFA